VFESHSRGRLANEGGIDTAHWKYQSAAGRHADISTLALAHGLGMQYTDDTMFAAGECNKLAEMKHARLSFDEQCCC
jgi:hypothetical protein